MLGPDGERGRGVGRISSAPTSPSSCVPPQRTQRSPRAGIRVHTGMVQWGTTVLTRPCLCGA